jgi:LysR family transcriptional regulator, regulator for bpeEF and oprC
MDMLQAMRVYTRIVESGSFIRASEALGLGAPTVSNLVRDLEVRLGCRLLNRTTRRLSLTDEGSTYYQHCIAILNDIDEMEDSLSDGNASPKGRLRVSVPSAMAKSVVIPMLPVFTASYPDISIELDVTDRVVDIVAGSVDCVVRVGELNDSGLVARQIGQMLICSCASPEYLEQFGRPATIDDLSGHTAIHYLSGETGRPRVWDFAANGQSVTVPMRGTVSVNDVDAHVACALAGLGLVRTSLYLVDPHLRAGTLERVLSNYDPRPRPVSVLYAPNPHVPRKLRVFIDWLVELYRGHPDFLGQS